MAVTGREMGWRTTCSGSTWHPKPSGTKRPEEKSKPKRSKSKSKAPKNNQRNDSHALERQDTWHPILRCYAVLLLLQQPYKWTSDRQARPSPTLYPAIIEQRLFFYRLLLYSTTMCSLFLCTRVSPPSLYPVCLNQYLPPSLPSFSSCSPCLISWATWLSFKPCSFITELYRVFHSWFSISPWFSLPSSLSILATLLWSFRQPADATCWPCSV